MSRRFIQTFSFCSHARQWPQQAQELTTADAVRPIQLQPMTLAIAEILRKIFVVVSLDVHLLLCKKPAVYDDLAPPSCSVLDRFVFTGNLLQELDSRTLLRRTYSLDNATDSQFGKKNRTHRTRLHNPSFHLIVHVYALFHLILHFCG